MRWDPMPSARDLAPIPFKDWEVLTSESAPVVDGAMLSLIEDRIAVLLGGARSTHEPSGKTERSCAEAIEQFLINVSELDDNQRDGVFSALGSRSYPFFQTLYIRDFDFRFRGALAQLFDD